MWPRPASSKARLRETELGVPSAYAPSPRKTQQQQQTAAEEDDEGGWGDRRPAGAAGALSGRKAAAGSRAFSAGGPAWGTGGGGEQEAEEEEDLMGAIVSIAEELSREVRPKRDTSPFALQPCLLPLQHLSGRPERRLACILRTAQFPDQFPDVASALSAAVAVASGAVLGQHVEEEPPLHLEQQREEEEDAEARVEGETGGPTLHDGGASPQPGGHRARPASADVATTVPLHGAVVSGRGGPPSLHHQMRRPPAGRPHSAMGPSPLRASAPAGRASSARVSSSSLTGARPASSPGRGASTSMSPSSSRGGVSASAPSPGARLLSATLASLQQRPESASEHHAREAQARKMLGEMRSAYFGCNLHDELSPEEREAAGQSKLELEVFLKRRAAAERLKGRSLASPGSKRPQPGSFEMWWVQGGNQKAALARDWQLGTFLMTPPSKLAPVDERLRLLKARRRHRVTRGAFPSPSLV